MRKTQSTVISEQKLKLKYIGKGSVYFEGDVWMLRRDWNRMNELEENKISFILDIRSDGKVILIEK